MMNKSILDRLSKKEFFSIKYLLSYLLISVIAMMFSGMYTIKAQQALESNIERFNLDSVSSIRDLVDERLMGMDAIISRIGSYHLTDYVLNLTDPVNSGQVYKLKEYVDFIHNQSVYASPKAFVTVYAPDNGYVIYDTAAAQYEFFSQETLRRKGKVEVLYSPKSGFNNFQSAQVLPAQSIHINGVKNQVVPYVQTLPLGSKRHKGNICIYIDHDSLFSGLVDSDISSYCYVTDKQNRLIAAISGKKIATPIQIPEKSQEGFFTKTLDGERMMVVYAKSQRGLTYVTVAPYSIVMSQSRNLRNIFFMTVFLSFVLCVVIAYMLVQRNVKPISAVYHMLYEHVGETSDTGKDLQYIKNSVSKLLHDNHCLQETMEKQVSEMRIAYLSRLLTGNCETVRDMQTSVDFSGLHKQDAFYTVVTVRINYHGDLKLRDSVLGLQMAKAKIRQTMRPASDQVTIVDTGVNQFAFVFSFDSEFQPYYKQYIELLISDLMKIMGEQKIMFKAAAGSPQSSLTGLYHSCQESILTLGSSNYRDDITLYWYEDAKKPGEIFYYPTEIEQKLVSHMRGGNLEELATLLDAVIHENSENLCMSDEMNNLLMGEMKATILKFAKEIYADNPEELSALSSKLTEPLTLPFRETLGHLRSEFIQLCQDSHVRKSKHSVILMQRIMDYIDEKYMDSNMSLSMIASDFGLSESYFSTFFKKQRGETFVSYVAKKRLSEACNLLAGKKYTVDETAKMVGYTSAHSFRRAFKKEFGVNPATHITREKKG